HLGDTATAADGHLVSIADNETLFQLLGTTYGGDGQSTFALPDLRGRAMVGTGQGSGLSDEQPGEVTGTESVTLTTDQIPAHTHTVDASVVTDPTGNGAPFSNVQPSLGIEYEIAVEGIFPSSDGGAVEPFLGEIRATAAPNNVPKGWMLAAGQLLSIAQ